MAGQTVVIVESPAKAKTINKYLGPDFTVVASFGHVRDLPRRDGSVRPDDDFEMDWELGERAKKHVDDIARAVRQAERVVLATDPDREGEAIAWHVTEILRERRLLGRVDVRRVTFNEITKSAVQSSMANPRDVNRELVEAYLARRALDYLVGFTLSPVLWRKLPGSKSAGRVQSVALRLICERESEIETFQPQEYWTIEADFLTKAGEPFTARLSELDGQKLDKFALGNQGAAEAALARILPLDFQVASVERKQIRRNPAPPFTTSTLQQEASRKLGLGASRTMRIAQKLYEGVDIGGETVGLITYMRTDGVQLAQEAIGATRSLIDHAYGAPYLPASPRVYKSQAKNAQEAHEAVRPTDIGRRPDAVAGFLERDERRLYELIWKRTVACQMASAVFDQVTVDLASPAGDVVFRATGSTLVFDGFLRVYQEDRDDAGDDDDKSTRLPPFAERDPVTKGEVRPEQHFTQPPPRYTEASLVKRLEELGIGRPSTYASILQVLQDREYVRLDKKRFLPEDRGRLVTVFLQSFFTRYVEYGFTADLENQLDDISGGRIDWKTVLRNFWTAFHTAVESTRDLTVSQVIDALDAELGPHFFRGDPTGDGDGSEAARQCPACGSGRLGLKLSRTGAFIGCSRYPECRHTRPLAVIGPGTEADDPLADGPRRLGLDPATGLPVSVRRGPYGAYVQLGPPDDAPDPAAAEEPAADEPAPAKAGKTARGRKAAGKSATKPAGTEAAKPKRVSLPPGLSPTEIDLDTALALLALPRQVGRHPESGEPIVAGIGRYGPYLKHGTAYTSLPADDDVLAIGLNRAVVLLVEGGGKRRAASGSARALGDHPDDGKPVTVGSGRFGPYVKHGKTYASLPKGTGPDEVTLDEAVALIAAKQARADGGTGAKGAKAAKTAKPAAKSAAKVADPAAPSRPARTKTAAGQSPAAETAARKTAGAKAASAKPPTGTTTPAKRPRQPRRPSGGDPT